MTDFEPPQQKPERAALWKTAALVSDRTSVESARIAQTLVIWTSAMSVKRIATDIVYDFSAWNVPAWIRIPEISTTGAVALNNQRDGALNWRRDRNRSSHCGGGARCSRTTMPRAPGKCPRFLAGAEFDHNNEYSIKTKGPRTSKQKLRDQNYDPNVLGIKKWCCKEMIGLLILS